MSDQLLAEIGETDADTKRLLELNTVLDWLTSKSHELRAELQVAGFDGDNRECERIELRIRVGRGWYNEILDERLAIVTRQRAAADRKLQTWQRAVTP